MPRKGIGVNTNHIPIPR